MELTVKNVGIALGVVAVTAFAFGRFSAPTTVKETSKTTSVATTQKDTNEDVKQNQDQNKNVVRETDEVVHPDGTRETRTKVTENTETVRSRETNRQDHETGTTTVQQETSKEVSTQSGKLSLAVLAGVKLNDFTSGPKYGGYVSRNFLGPITIGIWGFNDLSAGVSVGLSF